LRTEDFTELRHLTTPVDLFQEGLAVG
jgi:hypothetical protein